MRRPLLAVAIALLSLTAGACAGRISVTAVPAMPVAEVEPAVPQPDILPVRSITLADVTTAVPADEPVPESSCNLATEALAKDPELDATAPAVGTKMYVYVEFRGGSAHTFKDPEKQIALRVINKDTCKQDIVMITKRGDRLIAPDGWDIEAVRRANGIRWNNWATQYRINSPEHWVVLRNRYPYIKGDGKTRVVTYITYSSYSADLHLPELVENGRDYMTSLAERALDRLRELNVPSRAVEGVLLADTPIGRPEVSARLGPIEHMDFGEFAMDPQWSMEHVFIRIGLNGDEFARYTCSRAAACGLMQFTDNGKRDAKGVMHPGTYTMLRRLYPQAQLNPDFTAGASDPLNAMMASYLHHDNALRYLIGRFGPTIADNHQVLDELVGGIYNGGEQYTGDAYAASLKKHSADWTTALKSCARRPYTNCIPGETVGYVIKLRELIATEHRLANSLAQAGNDTPPTH